MARDPRAFAEAKQKQIEDIDPIDAETRERCRWVIAANSTDVDEAVEFMKMLGVHYSQDGIEDFKVGLNPNNPASQPAVSPPLRGLQGLRTGWS